MADRDPPQPADPDDWFAEQSATGRRRVAVETRGSTGEAHTGRLGGEPVAARLSRALAARNIDARKALVGAVALVVLIVAGLAVGGVFSGGKKAATSSTTASTPTTTQGTTTTSGNQLPGSLRPVPTVTLKPGDHGAQVKLLQRALAGLGYSAGKVDGDYGPSTQAALKRFQTASKLAADGVLGPLTLRALKRAVQRSG